MRYQVKQGQHDFKPNGINQITPILGRYSELITLDLDQSCWYDIKEFPGKDSWNKAGGVGAALSANNKSALLLAWRPDENFMHFRAAIYENDENGGWDVHGEVMFSLYDTACLAIVKDGGKLNAELFYVTAGDNHSERNGVTSYIWAKIPSILRRRGPWFGGRFPAPNDMEKWVSFKKWRSSGSGPYK
jgi:hypothetical protein